MVWRGNSIPGVPTCPDTWQSTGVVLQVPSCSICSCSLHGGAGFWLLHGQVYALNCWWLVFDSGGASVMAVECGRRSIVPATGVRSSSAAVSDVVEGVNVAGKAIGVGTPGVNRTGYGHTPRGCVAPPIAQGPKQDCTQSMGVLQTYYMYVLPMPLPCILPNNAHYLHYPMLMSTHAMFCHTMLFY